MPKAFKNILIVFLIVAIVFGVCKALNVKENIMKQMYPMKYSEYVIKYSDEYNVDPLLVYAVIKAESNFNKDAVSNRNAVGVMQLMDKTAEEVANNIIVDTDYNSEMLFDAEMNIKLGTKYLSELIGKYGNYYVAVAAYNAGIGTVDRWIEAGTIQADGSDIEKIPYKETNMYVRKIMRDYEIYKDLYKS